MLCGLFAPAPRKYESISPLDDLAFDMYQDPEVAHIIRLLDQKKQEMVQQEKYEQAKKLKQAIADLQKVMQLLGGAVGSCTLNIYTHGLAICTTNTTVCSVCSEGILLL